MWLWLWLLVVLLGASEACCFPVISVCCVGVCFGCVLGVKIRRLDVSERVVGRLEGREWGILGLVWVFDGYDWVRFCGWEH